MKAACMLIASVVLFAGIALIAGQQSNLFEGELEELNFRAPEFPPPEQEIYNSSAGMEPGAQNGPVTYPESNPTPGVTPQQRTTNAGNTSQPQTEFRSNGIVWINSRPLTMEKLRGQVVMLDLWEYTCINCIRTLPETIKWYERYHKYGFEVIGVHGPEFNIAYPVENVRNAVKRFGIPYPVVVDDQFKIFTLYHANAWPTRFLVDASGVVRFGREGEGGDRAFEQAIQDLLKQAHPGLTFPADYAIAAPKNPFAPGCGTETPEMYVGDWGDRGVLANPEGYHDGKTVDYKLPQSVDDGHVILGGKWKTDKNGMIYSGKKNSTGGKLEMRYHARELYSVMNVARAHPSRLYITQDGKDLTSENKGVDVQLDTQGHSYIEVRASRMYYLVQNPSDSSHLVVLTPTAPGITINSFTFGNNCQTDFAHL